MESLTSQIIIVFFFGVTFVVTLLVFAIKFPKPTPFQYGTFRITLSLAAAGVGAMIPGFINLEVNPTAGLLIRAGGALAVFVIVFFFNPAHLTTNGSGPSQSPIEGRWVLRPEKQPPEYYVNWMKTELHGTHLRVSGDKWTGEGSFDGQNGFYDWKFLDGKSGTTKLHLDDTGILHGEVHGSGIDWTYWATRQTD